MQQSIRVDDTAELSRAESQTAMVFVVGPSRSGTSLLCNILGKNSQILGLNELHVFGDLWSGPDMHSTLETPVAEMILAKLRSRQLRGIWADRVESEDLRFAKELLAGVHDGVSIAHLYRTFVRAVASEAFKGIVAEQTPRNILYANQLLDTYPEAKFVAMIRDPRAVLNSQRSRWKMRFLGASNVPLSETMRVFFNYHAITMSRLWIRAVEAAEALEGNSRVYLLRYEDLVNDPVGVINDVCVFLQVPFEESMLTVGRIGSSTQRNDEINAGISSKSLDAWENQLPEGDRMVCEYFTANAARRHGYLFGRGRLNNRAALFHLARFPLHVVGTLLANPRRVYMMAKALSGR